MEAFVAPTPDSVKAVTDWLTQHDIHAEAVSPSGDMLRIDIPVSKANTLLVANFTDFKDKNSGVTLTRTLSVTIPDDVAPHLQYIYPTTQYASAYLYFSSLADAQEFRFILPLKPKKPVLQVVKSPPSLSSKRQGVDFCAVDVFPQCLEGYYHIPTAPATASGNSIGVPEYLNEIATEDDLEAS